ncbi:hypothetical protein GGR56DRAFT_133773 [Xylariaceae sp. FL0804]|nr:hypothetical protein GGR56DRAFT_133773 [Xylariaceae sp. FL0804]
MTAATLHFSIPPERLDHDASIYLQPEVGPKWPLEAHDVTLGDLKPELSRPTASVQSQLDSRGFAVLKNKSPTVGSLESQQDWNEAYLEETKQMIKDQLGADEVFIWNSVTRSADPQLNTPYGGNHFQEKAVKGLQFGTTVRPTASGAHVDQDAANSRRMCRGAAGDDVFGRYARVQQLNVWRPLRGPVTSKPLAVCDGSSVPDRSKGIHCGMFGTRVTIHHDPAQRWYYIKRQEADEVFILKIYDSTATRAEYTPHTGVDVLHCDDGPLEPRESIEVRLVACYE